MTTQQTQRVLVGTLKSKAEEVKGQSAVITYQVMRDGMQYPDYVTLWPGEDGILHPPDVTMGGRYAWTVDAKPKGQGKKGEYLNLVNVKPADGVAAPQGQQALPPRGEFRTPEQIIRTYALECATTLATALIAKGLEMKSSEVMLVASKYAEYITTGNAPTAPKQAQALERADAPASAQPGAVQGKKEG